MKIRNFLLDEARYSLYQTSHPVRFLINVQVSYIQLQSKSIFSTFKFRDFDFSMCPRSRAHSRDPKVEKIINRMKGCNDLQRQITFYATDGGFNILNI